MSAGEITTEKTGLSRIPFTVAAEAKIKSLSFWLSILGWIEIAAGVLDLIVLVTPARNAGQIFDAVIALLVGYWCLQAATAFKKVATTDEADQAYLVQGFSRLRSIFLLQGIMILVGLAFATAVLLFLLLHGGGVKVN
jgi:hypothetical protein